MAAENVGKSISCDFYGMETKKFHVNDAAFILAKLVSAQIYKNCHIFNIFCACFTNTMLRIFPTDENIRKQQYNCTEKDFPMKKKQADCSKAATY